MHQGNKPRASCSSKAGRQYPLVSETGNVDETTKPGKQHLGLPKRPAKTGGVDVPIAHPMENQFRKLWEGHVVERAPQNRFREMSAQQCNISATTESCFSFLWSSQYGCLSEYQKCYGADRYSPLHRGCYVGLQSSRRV